ncbi:MAG: dephospho-CoA kinase [Bacteroidales bacterium]|nr:dephospho-CoA kinase [Bacteroidales bacterium]
MYKIALTGGIGTGKTYLSKNFIQMGIPVFYADDEAKKLYEDVTFQKKLIALFDHPNLVSNGKINIPVLSSLVFGNEENLQKLNRLVHPAVMDLFIKWAEEQQAPSVMMESAIVYEGGLTDFFDKIIVVDAPLELRIQRVQLRNPNLTREAILQRMSHQMSQEEKCRRADLVVCTGETYELSLDFLKQKSYF